MNVAAATQDTFRAPGAREALHYLRVLIPVTERGPRRPAAPPALQPPQRLPQAARRSTASRRASSRSTAATSATRSAPVARHRAAGCDPQQPWSLGGGPPRAFQRLDARAVVCRPMPRPPLPDVLVLAAGGILGEAWMTGVLAGIEDATGADFRDVESFVGTSAGSIVAARLAAGQRPRRPRGQQAGGDPGFIEDAPRLARPLGGPRRRAAWPRCR